MIKSQSKGMGVLLGESLGEWPWRAWVVFFGVGPKGWSGRLHGARVPSVTDLSLGKKRERMRGPQPCWPCCSRYVSWGLFHIMSI